ncbi:GAF domain-containing protein [Falsiroseomonas oryziterrae]|uniref:GAF domain-containing protein n=1 Tax=Falsiroseomonas oryziterrae TaxID=2911368 RepID=UPI001EFF7B9D|nr:GAF domain-containing protein [Roseomonas sp. NPKOSM-4]
MSEPGPAPGPAEPAFGVEAEPAFGEADLANCERERIHLAGSIQPHGLLLLVREPDHVVIQASANAAALLGLDAVLGQRLRDLGGDLAAAVLPRTLEALDAGLTTMRVTAGAEGRAFDAMLHRPAGGGLMVELEPAQPPHDIARRVETALQAFLSCYALRQLCEEAARVFRDIGGHDRVMVYRFADEGHGEVFAEQRRADLESYLGNRYPASDIPQVARRLYEKNRLRVVADVHYEPVMLEPRLNPLTGDELDLSLSMLRSVSPMHVQYLKNMGVGATMVASVMVGGRLWGLVACHHETPRRPPLAVRAAAELLAEALGTRIAALESFVQAQAELSVRRLEQRLVEAISREGDWRAALFDSPATLLHPLGATGAVLLFEGQVQTLGEVPATPHLRALGDWLDAQPRGLVQTHSLRQEAPGLDAITPVAAGILAVPISASSGEYLVWMRPEQQRTLIWGGDPTKPVEISEDGLRTLAPRRSFAKWHQLVEGSAEPWSAKDVATARLIGDSVADVVIQFRSVRLLIAEDQLAQVRRQVAVSEQPVLICDARGAIALVNDAFDRLLPGLRGARPRRIEELAPFFAHPAEIRRRLHELVENRQSWSGELRLADDDAEAGRPMLVRADPVFSSPDRILGFVLLFNDLGERKAADAARRRFQDVIAESHRTRAGWLDRHADMVFQGILASLVENAQLAALEIAEGVEVGRMPEMLESVRASVARTTEVLEMLARQLGAEKPQPWDDA